MPLRHIRKWRYGSLQSTLILNGVIESFMPQPLGTELWYWLNRRLNGSQNWSGCFGEVKNPLPALRTELQLLGCPAHNLITTDYSIMAY